MRPSSHHYRCITRTPDLTKQHTTLPYLQPGAHLAFGRTEVFLDADGPHRLRHGDELGAVELVGDGVGVDVPVVDHAARVDVRPHAVLETGRNLTKQTACTGTTSHTDRLYSTVGG